MGGPIVQVNPAADDTPGKVGCRVHVNPAADDTPGKVGCRVQVNPAAEAVMDGWSAVLPA